MVQELPPRIRLASLPTPLEHAGRLSEHWDGPQIWVKRDVLTGFGLSGNKDAVRFVPWPKDALCVETGDYCTDFSKLCDRIELPEQVDLREGVRRTLASLGRTRGAMK